MRMACPWGPAGTRSYASLHKGYMGAGPGLRKGLSRCQTTSILGSWKPGAGAGSRWGAAAACY